jgi:Domain of unknown function (DUF4136)
VIPELRVMGLAGRADGQRTRRFDRRAEHPRGGQRRARGARVQPAAGHAGRLPRALQNESEIKGDRWQVQEYHYTVGTVSVALAEPDSKQFLWRGGAQGILDPSASGDKQAQDIRDAVQKMFADFPT